MEISEPDLRKHLNDTEKKHGCKISGPFEQDEASGLQNWYATCVKKENGDIEKCLDAIAELEGAYRKCIFLTEKPDTTIAGSGGC
jgi:hypothetical protein